MPRTTTVINVPAATKELDVDHNLSLNVYIRLARNLHHQADVFRAEGNQLQLYVFLLRFISLALKTIPDHKDSRAGKMQQERTSLKRQAISALDELERLKPAIQRMVKGGEGAQPGDYQCVWEDEDATEFNSGGSRGTGDHSAVPVYYPTPSSGGLHSATGAQSLFSGSWWTAPATVATAAAVTGSSFPSSPLTMTAELTPVGSSSTLAQVDNMTDSSLEAWSRSIALPAEEQQRMLSLSISSSSPAPSSTISTTMSFLSSSSQPAQYHSSSTSSFDSTTHNNDSSNYYTSSYYTPSSISFPAPRQETLARHSLFELSAPSSHSEWSTSTRLPPVSYPSQIDSSPVTLPDLLLGLDKDKDKEDQASDALQPPQADDGAPLGADGVQIEKKLKKKVQFSEEVIAASAAKEQAAAVAAQQAAMSAVTPIPRQLAPPPMPVPVQEVPGGRQLRPDEVADPQPGGKEAKTGIKAVHFSTRMMDEFMRVVAPNTRRNLETCAVLAGVLKKGKFLITTLILPKQQATSDSCSTLNEEELFEVQDKRGLFQLGWIHTHPSQSCFMSSVDLHTHYSYQVMLPEAIAIVMAPSDSNKKFGVFRLTDPGGMGVISRCHDRGFHSHPAPSDGSPIYSHSASVFFNPSIKFDVVDLR